MRPQLHPEPADGREDDDREDELGGYELSLAEFSQTILWMGLLAAIAIVFTGVSVAGAFLDQDGPRVTQNLALRSWSGLAVIWRWPHQFPDFSPLTYTLHLLEARAWGIQGERVAAGYRAVNVLFHAGSVLLLFQLLRRLAIPGAFAAAAVFAVHPANASAVGWVSQRPAMLGTFFGLAALIVLLRITGVAPRPAETHRFFRLPERPAWLWAWAAVAVGLTLTASPAIAATLGPVLLVLAWWKRGRPLRRDWRAAAPLLLVTIVVLAGAAVLAARRSPAWSPLTLDGVAWWQRPTAMAMQFAADLWMTVAPFRLQFAYRPFEIDWLWGTLAWLLAAVLVVGATLAARRGRRGPAATLATFAILLLPALLWVEQDDLYGGWTAPHLLYPATAAMIAGVVSVVAAWLERRGGSFAHRGAAPVTAATACVAVLVLGGFAIERGYRYQSQQRLWADVIRKDPSHLVAAVRLGESHLAEGELAEAERLFRGAARLEPKNPLPLVMLGQLFERRSGDDPSARARARDAFIAALALDPDNFDATCGKARTLQAMGDSSAALAEFERARLIRPRDPMLHTSIGLVYFERGEFARAEECYRHALALDARCTAARINLALVLHKQNKVDAAADELLRAVEIDPNSYEAFMNAGAMLGQMGQFEKAVRAFRTAVYLKKDAADAYANLGMALIGQSSRPGLPPAERVGMLGESAFCFERAAALNPKNPLYPETLQRVRQMRQSLLGGGEEEK